MSTDLTIQLVRRLFEAFLQGQGRLRVEDERGRYTRVLVNIEGKGLEIHVSHSDTNPRILRVILNPNSPQDAIALFTTEEDARLQVRMLGIIDEAPGHAVKRRIHEHFLTVLERQSHALVS